MSIFRTTRFRLLGIQANKHSKVILPYWSNTRRERRPSLNKHLPRMHKVSETALSEQTTPASRVRKATCGFPNGYRVIRGTTVVTSLQGYTLKSVYHTVVGKELVDGVQKTGILSVPRAPKRSMEFLAIKLFAS